MAEAAATDGATVDTIYPIIGKKNTNSFLMTFKNWKSKLYKPKSFRYH